MATIVTRAGKGSALTFAEMDANFTNLNDELANITLGVLPANSVSATELDNSDDYTVSTLTTTGNVIVGDSLIPSSGNLEINTDYLQVSSADGTNRFKIRTDQAPGPDQVLKYNDTTGFVQWANDLGQSSAQVQSSLDAQNLGDHADVDTTGVTDGQALVYVSANAQWEAGTVASTTELLNDTSPQLGGDLDTNGFELTASATGEIRLGDGADRYATVDMNADKLRLSNIGLDLADQLIVTSTTNGDIKLRPDGTGGVRIGDTNTDVELKTDGGALTIKTTANNADITIEPHGTGKVNMLKYKAESTSLGDLPIFSRTSTNTGATSFQARQNYSTTARAAGQTAGAMNFSNVNDVDALGTFYVGLVQGLVGDEGTFGSAGENNNAILLKTFVQNSGAFPTNTVGEFRYASAGFMNGNLTFDDTSGVITIEAATANDDLTLKTSGTGDITMDPSGTGYIILNNLPTSATGLPTGALWNDSGTLKIA